MRREPSLPFRYQRRRPGAMTERRLLAVSGTPGTGKTHLCDRLARLGWTVHPLAALAEQHGFLGETDAVDGAAPIDIHRLAEAWEGPTDGLHAVDGHLSHFLEVDGVVMLRCEPGLLRQRLEQRGYQEPKIRANVEWEMMAGAWSELLEFEIDLPVLELDSGRLDDRALSDAVQEWVTQGLPSEPLADGVLSAIDWLAESRS